MPATSQTPYITDTLKAIRALSDLHGTHSTIDEERALDAVQAGRAAFWTTASYHNQIAGIFLTAVNRSGLAFALKQCARDEDPDYMRHSAYLLGTLVPLNPPACAAVNAAWSSIGETWDAIRRARAAMPVPMFAVAAE